MFVLKFDFVFCNKLKNSAVDKKTHFKKLLEDNHCYKSSARSNISTTTFQDVSITERSTLTDR